MRLRRWLRFVAAIVALDAAFVALAWLAAPLAFQSWDATCDDRTALVVLFGGENSDTDRRVNAALQALEACPALTALLVGGARAERGYFGSEEMRQRLVEAGIDGARLTSERSSFDTDSNADAAVQMAAGKALERLVVVSDALHIARVVTLTQLRPGNGYAVQGLPVSLTDAPGSLWWRPHYELVAWTLAALPAGVQATILGWVRN